MRQWLQARLTDYTPGVGRVFVACRDCRRVVPHYRVTGTPTRVGCRCGGGVLTVVRLPTWRAAWWVLSALVWRRFVRREAQWDPRMPLRHASSRYA